MSVTDRREALRQARPYVAHHDDVKSFQTHTAEVLANIDAAIASDMQQVIDGDAIDAAFDKWTTLAPSSERAALHAAFHAGVDFALSPRPTRPARAKSGEKGGAR